MKTYIQAIIILKLFLEYSMSTTKISSDFTHLMPVEE
jgi:hypothetical protein